MKWCLKAKINGCKWGAVCTMELLLDTTSHKILQHFSGQMPHKAAGLNRPMSHCLWTARAGAKNKIHWDLIGLSNTKASQNGMKLVSSCACTWWHGYNLWTFTKTYTLLPKNFPRSSPATIPAQTSNVSKTLAKSWQNFHLKISLIPLNYCKCWMNLDEIFDVLPT